VSGARKREADGPAAAHHHAERSYGSFARAISLPKGIASDDVSASFTDGVLEVQIPKPEQVKPRRIEIGVNAQQDVIAA
jgi:HSP20 family protein